MIVLVVVFENKKSVDQLKLPAKAALDPRREGERGAESREQTVDHYEGERDAEQVVRVERPHFDATIMSESYV